MPKNNRKTQLREANEEEDATIRRLEKALKLKKRKRKKKNSADDSSEKKIPGMFKEDGLDYILGVLDAEQLSSDLSGGEEAGSSRTALNHSPRKQKTGNNEQDKPRRLADLIDDDDDHNIDSCNEDLSSCNDDDDEEKDSDQDNEQDVSEKPIYWEDIYGRIRDKEGNVVESEEHKANTYVPPAKRLKIEQTDDIKKAEISKIKKQLKGYLNRLSESNMQPICSQVEQLYMKNSRNDMNETLASLVSELVITPTLTPPRLIMEQAMMVAVLHALVGPEVGAYFLQSLATRFHQVQKTDENYGPGKLCNNLLTFLSHLYNFKVTHCTLMFDILKSLIDSFKDKDIELIQLILKTVGFSLRKDNPLKLKEIVHLIQEKAPSFKSKEDSSRVQFMLDTLIAIRNNNMYKIPDYDPSIVEHMKKVLRGLLRQGCSVQELAISLEDLLNAEEKGRWWIVGSAWSERTPTEKDTNGESHPSTLKQSGACDKVLALARKQHMNTDIRRAIFCVLMSAVDYMDCFEKLLRLNLKNEQEREIISVILHCLMNEKEFNPYYAVLTGKFCEFARKYRMNLQFALWDKFKEMNNFKTYQTNNLARFLSHLFVNGDLSISVLKAIQFSEMNKRMVKFFRQVLLGVLLDGSEETCRAAFERIAAAQNLELLREGLRLFMHHFLLQDSSDTEPHKAEQLKQRVEIAEEALNSAKHVFRL